MASMSQEERMKIFAQIQDQMKKGGSAKKGDTKADASDSKRGGEQKGAGMMRAGGGPPGAPGAGGPNPLDLMQRGPIVVAGFTAQDRENAKLPLPPEEDSQLQVLLRPGLLADVEIIIEKLPNVLHVPAQAVFEKNGKPIVYVQKGKNFQAREIQLVKRSETMMVLAGGVQANEVISLSDPTARADGKKGKGEKKGGGGGAMSSLPGGK
jgi:HlyD family secretion protein